MKQYDRQTLELEKIYKDLKIILEIHSLDVTNLRRALIGNEWMDIEEFMAQLVEPSLCEEKYRVLNNEWVLLGIKNFGDITHNFMVFRDGHCCERWEYRELPNDFKCLRTNACIWC